MRYRASTIGCFPRRAARERTPMAIPFIADTRDVLTPSLAVWPSLIESNIHRMLDQVGGRAEQLRPHVKTHKMAEVVAMQRKSGIERFKASTIAECEMLALAGAGDVLLAIQPVGPNMSRLARLTREFPGTRFSTIGDDEPTLAELSSVMSADGLAVDLLLDLDTGLHRTGVAPTDQAVDLYERLARSRGLRMVGLHVYDGHVRDADGAAREAHAKRDFEAVDALAAKLRGRGHAVETIVAGGTPTFPTHAKRRDVQSSPGTCLLWDYGYASKFSDLRFDFAALLLTRVISRPAADTLCLDLGYKAVSPDNPTKRVHFLDVEDAEVVVHNEEHLVVRTRSASRFKVGDLLRGVPMHVCPTCASHREVYVVDERGRVAGTWRVAARDRVITI